MINATRIAVAAAAFSALAVVACTASPPDDTLSVSVEQGTVDPNCIKGGLTCGTTYGGTSGRFPGLTSGYVSSSGTLDPGDPPPPPPTYQPPKGADPINCGDCRWIPATSTTVEGCDCGGAGNGLQSGIVCPVAYPCRYYVWGAYRCYALDSYTGTCR